MFKEGTFFASHVLHEVLGDKAKVFFDLFDEPITVFEIKMSETKDFLEVIGEQFAADIQPVLF